MITKDELKNYAQLTGLNLGQAEKDYFQNIILFIIYQEYGKEIVFKGGTALKKCYGLNRFSEDLDFTCENSPDIEKISKGLERFRLEFEEKTTDFEREKKSVFWVRGPLFIGAKNSMCRIELDFSLRENVVLKPVIKTIGRFLEEIPSFDVYAMQEKEILAEKIRAVLTREKARDAYDAWFLLGGGIELDIAMINEKLKYYSKKWSSSEFEKKLDSLKSIWKTEMESLVKSVPEFVKVRRFIMERIKQLK